MERLKSMKEALMNCAQSQIHGNLNNVDAKELGEVIDMIKDIEETIYYCTVVEAMEETEDKGNRQHQIYYPMYYTPYYITRDMDRDIGKMYYTSPDHGRMINSMTYSGDGRYVYNGSVPYSRFDDRRGYSDGSGQGSTGSSNMGSSSGGHNGGRSYMEGYERYPMEIRDAREGRSSMTRRSYMEGKELHKDKGIQMKELEKYMHELADDITEMVEDASPEEKTLLKEK